jgi:hypothetical protein
MQNDYMTAMSEYMKLLIKWQTEDLDIALDLEYQEMQNNSFSLYQTILHSNNFYCY